MYFYNEDFSNVDFDKFSMGFTEFSDCILDGAKRLYGQPITIYGGSARGLDLRGSKLILRAVNCDLRGVKIDKGAELVESFGDMPITSSFIRCDLDSATRDMLIKLGVTVS